MTCTSDRSGSASRGVFITATTPPTMTNRQASRTRNGFRPDHWMILDSMASAAQWPECEVVAALVAGATGLGGDAAPGAALIDVTMNSPGWRSTNSKPTF